MGFIMDGLDEETYDRKYDDRQLVARIIGYFRPQLQMMLFVALLVVLTSLMDTAFPILIARSLDTLTTTQSAQSTVLLVVIILITGVLSWTFNFLRQRYTARSVGNVVLALQQDAFAAIVARDMSFYDEYPSGKIVSRVTSDTEKFATVVTLTLNLLSQLLLFFLIAAVLFYINARLALLALTITPAIVAIALGFRWIARRTTRRSQRSLARVNANVQEAISGITVAKNFRQEQNMYDAFKKVNQQSYYVNVRSGFVYNGVFPLLFLVANVGTTIVIYFGGLNVLNGTISAGEWFLFVQSIGILWFPLTSIASFWSQFQLGLSASERVFALIDAEPRVRQIDHQPVPRLEGRIEFKDIFFQYTEQQTVLAGFNLVINAGETVALVGHTGAGKSSLGKLVARFYEFQGGELLIDGHDIRTFDLQAYHRQLGVVPQVPFLFSGTVADNIRYARPEASDEEVDEVAQYIGWGDWLEALPDGLNTEVGEEGKALSMGQRQLVALARVLLQDPSIIVFDEATASVDPLTEAQIQEGLDLVLENRTAIVIAHRLSTIRHANRIIVLSRGKIVEEGNHDALIAQGGHYAQLYNTFFRHQSPDYRPGEGFIPVLIPSPEAIR
ncbi:MAG: ABC transporter [Ktedonobacter sp. 13_1_40CM_4_52_4]|nr:MAG: ABC transporter [Ktedonobacter sp. 13_1_40CM_4_52_4]